MQHRLEVTIKPSDKHDALLVCEYTIIKGIDCVKTVTQTHTLDGVAAFLQDAAISIQLHEKGL